MIDIGKANQAEVQQLARLDQEVLVLNSWRRLMESEHWAIIRKHLAERIEALREALCQPIPEAETQRIRNQIECYRDLLRQPELAHERIAGLQKQVDRLRSNQKLRHTYGLEGRMPANQATQKE